MPAKILIIQENGRHARNRDFRECFAFQRAFRHLGLEAEVWGLGHTTFTQPFADASRDCDAVLLLENYDQGWLPDLAKVAKRKAFWCIDAHMGVEPYLAMARRHRFDLVFNASPDFVDAFKPFTQTSLWLPNAYDHFLIDRLPGVRKTVPLGFCGNVVNRGDWIAYLKQRWGLRHDEMVIGPDMVQAVNSYQIHWNRNVGNDLNYRTFETLGCGTFLLTNPTPGLDRLFQPGRHLMTYADQAELDAKLDHYLKHPEECMAIAEQGYQHVRQHHTYVNRAQAVMTALQLSPSAPTTSTTPLPMPTTLPSGTSDYLTEARNLVRSGLWMGAMADLAQPRSGDGSEQGFGGSAITKELFEWLLTHLPPGSTILELGSGHGSTQNLSRFYKMYSVEDKAQFVGLYDSQYIHAPIVDNWYSLDVLRAHLPRRYDLLLVDGPTGEGNRWGFFHHLDLFNLQVPIVFDDTWRKAERDMMHEVARATGKKLLPFPDDSPFGVLV